MPIIDVDTPTASLSELFPDGVHPNDTGYALVAQVMHDGLLAPRGTGGQGGPKRSGRASRSFGPRRPAWTRGTRRTGRQEWPGRPKWSAGRVWHRPEAAARPEAAVTAAASKAEPAALRPAAVAAAPAKAAGWVERRSWDGGGNGSGGNGSGGNATGGDAGTSTGGNGVGSGGATEVDAGVGDSGGSGCSCSLARGGQSGGVGLLLAALAFLLRRRRAR